MLLVQLLFSTCVNCTHGTKIKREALAISVVPFGNPPENSKCLIVRGSDTTLISIIFFPRLSKHALIQLIVVRRKVKPGSFWRRGVHVDVLHQLCQAVGARLVDGRPGRR